MLSTSVACPQCLLSAVRRSRRRFFDWPMVALGFKAVRCTSCGLRFYRNPSELANSRRTV